MPTPLITFAGLADSDNIGDITPPDPNGDVGPNHYVQTVNGVFAVYDKQGNRLYGPAANNTIWTGFGGDCETHNDGDPVALYDSISDRWLMSQFAIPATHDGGPSYECIAISASPDPTGSWHRYAFLLSNNEFYDYPKLGVWPDAYYLTDNVFSGGVFVHNAAVAFDRTHMLAGQAATFQAFNTQYGGMLPADLDGPTLPPAGSPDFFLMANPPDLLRLWKFRVDWSNPNNSTFTGPTDVTVATFNTTLCNDPSSHCVPQPNTAVMLDSLKDAMMNRLVYRNMGSYEALLANDTVNADGQGHAGVRWYELRNPNGTPLVHQQGTYGPADGDYRWMASLAMDAVGDIAVGFSVSSGSTYPSIRYAGRLASDPLGTLAQGEASLMAGGGSQNGSTSRWGDYTTMSIDPSDDCTFWYNNEYYPVSSPQGWNTRIGSFRFPGCVAAGTPTPPPPTLTPGGPPTATPTPGACTLQFTDVPVGSTFYPYIHCLACLGIINGYATGCDTGNPCFKPNNNVTRGQIAKIVSNAAGFNDDVTGMQTYTDVPPDSTFWLWIERLSLHQVMGGYQCGNDPNEPCDPQSRPYFRPGNNATRGQLSKIVSNAANFNDPPGNQMFEDVDPSSAFFTYTQRLASRNVISGYQCGVDPNEPCVPPDNLPYFRPGNNVTRGQASKIVSNSFYPNCNITDRAKP
jgi:hypothetical protein